MKIFGWERDWKDPWDWLEVCILIPLRYIGINHCIEGYPCRQGFNFGWSRGPLFVLLLGHHKWRLRIRSLRPHILFSYTRREFYPISTGYHFIKEAFPKLDDLSWKNKENYDHWLKTLEASGELPDLENQ